MADNPGEGDALLADARYLGRRAKEHPLIALSQSKHAEIYRERRAGGTSTEYLLPMWATRPY